MVRMVRLVLFAQCVLAVVLPSLAAVLPWFGGHVHQAVLLSLALIPLLAWFWIWRSAAGELWREIRLPVLCWAALLGLVAISYVNPSHGEEEFMGLVSWTEREHWWWLPASLVPDAVPVFAWLWAGWMVQGLAVYVIFRSRSWLIALGLVIVLHAFVLSLLGIYWHLQKLATGDWLVLGRVRAPEEFFFSSFLYHNHWSAFAVLAVAVGLGLWYQFFDDHVKGRAFAKLVLWVLPPVLLVIAATIPLATSRIGTLVLGGVVVGAVIYSLYFFALRLGFSVGWKLGLGVSLACIAVFGGALWFSVQYGTFERKLGEAVTEYERWNEGTGFLTLRLPIYADTLEMIKDKPVWGWGLGNFQYAFVFYVREEVRIAGPTGYHLHFHRAHNDWLEVASEVGIVGLLLLVVPGFWWARRLPAALTKAPFPVWMCFAGGVILIYALADLPFDHMAVGTAFVIVTAAGLCALPRGETEKQLNAGGKRLRTQKSRR